MKRITLLLLLLLAAHTLPAQTQAASAAAKYKNALVPGYDPRTELLSVVFHVAGAPEYCDDGYPWYTNEVDGAFGKHSDHKAVVLARQLYGRISYDAVMHLATKLLWDDTLRLDPSVGEEPGNRWTAEEERQMATLLNDFVKQTNFRDFYERHTSFYEEVKAALGRTLGRVDPDWFDRFFGTGGKRRFEVLASVLNCEQNYSIVHPDVSGEERVTLVVGGCHPNEKGKPHIRINIALPIIAHEFCHAYCNPLGEKCYPMVARTAEQVFDIRRDVLVQQAYTTPLIMLNENLVRAATICYLKEHLPKYNSEKAAAKEVEQGFLLVPSLVRAFSLRDTARYPTMDQYMPVLCDTINAFSVRKFKKQQRQLAKQAPRLVECSLSMTPTIGTSRQTFTLTFSKPMSGNVRLFNHPEGLAFPPLDKSCTFYEWSDDKKTVTIFVNLMASGRYGFKVDSSFTSADGFDLDKDYIIEFESK